MPFPVFEILPILGTECIGDSRPKINTNFNSLSASANFASMRVTELSSKWTSFTDYAPYPDSGFIKLASGIIFQWGKVNGVTTDGQLDVYFPYQGMTKVFNISTTHILNSTREGVTVSAPCSIRSDYSTTKFTLMQDSDGTNAASEMWFAIGA